MEEDLIEISERFNRPLIACDPWQLTGSQQRLRGQLAMSEMKMTSETVRRLSETLLRLVRDQQLRLYPDSDLERELLGLQMVSTGYGWRMDHRSGGFSDRAMALSMAALIATESPTTSSEGIAKFRQLNGDLSMLGGVRRTNFGAVVGVPSLPRLSDW